jgi:tripartite-type tricarboxylate transporter receptor subunit TctC
MPPLRRRAVLGALALPLPAKAEERTITWVVPFAAGGITDSTSRVVAQRMAQALGQTIVVENRPGAGGTIGTESVARAAPDGLTVLYGTVGPLVVQPILNPGLRYALARDFAPIHGLGASPNMLVVPPTRGWRSMADVVAAARAQPDGLSFGSSGVGTSLHLCGELLQAATGIRMVHVPYVNGAQGVADLIAGRLDLMFDFPLTAMAHVKDGRLRALAVTDRARAPIAPDVPTTAEAGFPEVTLTSWAGLFAPGGTPAPIIARLAAATAEALRDPRVIAHFAGTATTLWAEIDTVKLAALMVSDPPRMQALLARAGAR